MITRTRDTLSGAKLALNSVANKKKTIIIMCCSWNKVQSTVHTIVILCNYTFQKAGVVQSAQWHAHDCNIRCSKPSGIQNILTCLSGLRSTQKTLQSVREDLPRGKAARLWNWLLIPILVSHVCYGVTNIFKILYV